MCVDGGQESPNAHNDIEGHGAVTEEEEEEEEEEVEDSSPRDDEDRDTVVVCPVLNCSDDPQLAEFEDHMAEKHSQITNR